MTSVQMRQAFKFGLDKLDSVNYPNFLSEEIDLLLNQAQERFIKQRYGITNVKRTSFEETEKRTEDLKEVTKQAVLTPTTNIGYIGTAFFNITTNSVFCVLPSDHWFTTWERAFIHSDKCNIETITIQYPATTELQCIGCPTCDPEGCPGNTIEVTIPSYTEVVTGKWVEVRPTQHLEFDKNITDPFKGPDYDKILRLMYTDQVELVPASYSTVTRYMIRYIKKPLTIDSISNPTVDCELSEHTHQEIVDMAIQIALEGIEAKRNSTFTPIINNTNE